MKRYVLFLIVFLSTLTTKAGFGLSDWECNTPGGNRIGDYGSGIILSFMTSYQEEYEGKSIIRWYFYKGHIIGETTENGKTVSGFFVMNDEATADFKEFKSRKSWDNYLIKKALKPKIWTRWYAGNWVFFGEEFFVFSFILFFISIPLSVLFLSWCYKAIWKERLNIRKPYTLIVSIISGLVILTILFERFPQSI